MTWEPPGVVLRQYIDCHPSPAHIKQEEYAARVAIETAKAELDGVEVVPARLIRSDAALRRVADELGSEAGEVCIQGTHAVGNQRDTQSRTKSKSWMHWARRSAWRRR